MKQTEQATQTTQPISLLDQLNDAQRAAVTAPFGSQLVIAGAGSGKTRVITSRIAYLMEEHQAPAQSILALTFTNKAGNEMKERIKKYLPGAAMPFVGTFHSYCVRLLRQQSHLLPFQNFSILDTDDQRGMIKKIMVQYGVEKHVTPSKMQGMISFEKNHLPEQRGDNTPNVPFFKEVREQYEREKDRAHAYDFDDLLVVTLDLLRKNPALTALLQERIRHLLVDEYQDTNQIQHALLKQLALDPTGKLNLDSVCAVGDQDQSIYSWRGAQATNMDNFAKDFGPAQRVSIEQNYRSVQPILQAANAVIANNPKRMEKKLWSSRAATSRLLSAYCQTGAQEAQLITQTVTLARQRTSLNDMAILYRTHHQSRLLEESLMQSGTPYIIIGGIRFYERKEIRDLLAYLRLLTNPFDRLALMRIINTPTRGIGNKCIELLQQQWDANPLLDCVQILAHIHDNVDNGLNRSQRAGFSQLHTLLTTLPANATPSTLVNHIIAATGFRDFMRKTYDEPELSSRLDNIAELAQAVQNFESENPEAGLEGFLEHIMLMQEKSSQDDAATEQISLMTLHAAKGLEFELVIIAGLEEELFPSARSLHSDDDIQEERRLMYVGATRAKEWLLLTHSQLRATYGSITQQQPSRFLNEVPQNLIAHHDLREEPPIIRAQTIAQWLGVTPPKAVQTFQRSHVARPTSSPRRAPRPVVDRRPAAYQTNQPARPRAPWRTRMPVIHTAFGVGIVQRVEHKVDDEYYLTISFKVGTKKLSSKFVKRT